MPLIVYRGPVPVCVEEFPDETERSCEGALYLRPQSSKEITVDEYAWLVSNRVDISKHVIKIRD